MHKTVTLWAAAAALTGCTSMTTDQSQALLSKYTTVPLTTPLDRLSDAQLQMLPLLIDAAKLMDQLFWRQAYGDRDQLLASITGSGLRRFAEINYGPWDRLDDNAPFIANVGPKPPGARFYPADITKEVFDHEAATASDGGAALRSLYTMVVRGSERSLRPVPYHQAFAVELAAASDKLREAAALAEDPGLRFYLERRARALETSDYADSDRAWLDMKDNVLDIVIGPIETYEDQLFGAKAAFEAYVLVKDVEWSSRLSRYATFLPALQTSLPVEDEYKEETPGSDAQLGAYDVVYYAGDCNAGSKTIAINLPNDEVVQLEKGTRRLQLKNAMRAKFDKILVPISTVLIAAEQRKHITFDAFFANTMFHEVAHGLGIKRIVGGERTVREALQEQASAVEEGKADVLGLWMITWLKEHDELGDTDLRDNYVTFVTSVFRSIRFGASSAHGRANLVRFNFFRERGAIVREGGKYSVDFDKIAPAVRDLSARILTLQGNGDYTATRAFMEQYGTIGAELQADLDRVSAAGIPVDVVFEQGTQVLGLRR